MRTMRRGRKRLRTALCMCALMLLGAVAAQADSYTFVPGPPGLGDMPHNAYFTWGIDWAVPEGDMITGATLFFDDLRNWNWGENYLFVHLLDTAAPGLAIGHDADDDFVDAFDGQGTWLFTWSLPPYPSQDKTYDFAQEGTLGALASYVSNDHNFGFGLDPDCHYWNRSVTLTIETTPIPAPGAALLGALGLGLVGWWKRRVS